MTVEPSIDHRTAPAPAPTAATRETLEDYTLRFAPRSYRKRSTGGVVVSAHRLPRRLHHRQHDGWRHGGQRAGAPIPRDLSRLPGRLVSVGFNLMIAPVLMEAGRFGFPDLNVDGLNTILGFYANCGMAWIVVVASDIVFNKYLLKLSPKDPEFRRSMLYAANPVGFVSRAVAAGVSILVFVGGPGDGIKLYSPLVTIVLALVLPPLLAIVTRGKYYLRRTSDGIELPMYYEQGNPSGEVLSCDVCRQDCERPDMAACETHDAYVCSLCLSTDQVANHVLAAQA